MKFHVLDHSFLCSVRSGSEVGNIVAALEVTKSISTQANNTIHLSLIEGSTIKDQELGDLILQVSDRPAVDTTLMLQCTLCVGFLVVSFYMTFYVEFDKFGSEQVCRDPSICASLVFCSGCV